MSDRMLDLTGTLDQCFIATCLLRSHEWDVAIQANSEQMGTSKQ